MQPVHPSTKLVLIVDDDDNVRGFLETFVANEGFRTAIARNGAEALEQAGRIKPSLVITDLRMPGEGGYEVLRKLQGDGTSRIPVIVITATKLDDSTIAMIRQEANVAEFIPKPIQIPLLIDTLHNTLGTQRPEQKPRPIRERGI